MGESTGFGWEVGVVFRDHDFFVNLQTTDEKGKSAESHTKTTPRVLLLYFPSVERDRSPLDKSSKKKKKKLYRCGVISVGA